MATEGPRSVRQQKRAINKRSYAEDQTADVTRRLRSVRQQKKAYNKRNSDEGQTANLMGESRPIRQHQKAIIKRSSDPTVDATCRCRASKKTFCHYCKKSRKRFKLLTGNRSDKLTDEPAVEIVASVVTEEGGSRFGSRYWDVNFNEYFSKNFKKVLEIKPRNGWFTIRYFNGKICNPTRNTVNVYNTTGTNLKDIDINFPNSIEKAINGDLFIACCNNSGLYVMGLNEAPQKLCDGSFADVYAYRDKVYALEYEKKLIMEFYCISDNSDVKQRWRSEEEWRVDELSHNDRLIVTGDKDIQFCVSHYFRHKISLYNTQGQCIKQFGSRQETGDGNLRNPWLCGVDRQAHLLVADWGKNIYKILDPGTGQWRLTGVRGETWVFDAALDDVGNLWLSQHNGSEFIITKHEPQ